MVTRNCVPEPRHHLLTSQTEHEQLALATARRRATTGQGDGDLLPNHPENRGLRVRGRISDRPPSAILADQIRSFDGELVGLSEGELWTAVAAVRAKIKALLTL